MAELLFISFGGGSSGTVGPSNVVYVDIAGDDGTGARGDASKPFLTPTAAIAAMTTNLDQMRLGPGLFVIAATLSPPAAVDRFSVVGSGKGITTIGAGNGIDIFTLNGTMDGVTIADITLTPKAGGSALIADGSTALGGFFQSLPLVMRNVEISGNLSMLYVGYFEFFDCDMQDAGNTWTIDTCSQGVIEDCEIAANVDILWDDDDAVKPSVSPAAIEIRSSSLTNTLDLSQQGSVVVDSETFVNTFRGTGLTQAVTAYLSKIHMFGRYVDCDFGSAGRELPDTVNSMDVRFDGSVARGTHTIAVGGAAANFQSPTYHGATIVSIDVGDGIRAQMRAAAVTGSLATQIVTSGTGEVYPPPFSFGPIGYPAAGPQVVPLPFKLTASAAPYQVSVDYDKVPTTSFCVHTRTQTAFTVDTQFADATTSIMLGVIPA